MLVNLTHYSLLGQIEFKHSATGSFIAEHGFTYQLQSTDSLAIDTEWTNFGQPILGTGQSIEFNQYTDQDHRFFRVHKEGKGVLTDNHKEIIQNKLKEFSELLELPGISVGVQLNQDKKWTTAVGVADLASGEALTPEHTFRIGSATKSFVAMTVIQLIKQRATYNFQGIELPLTVSSPVYTLLDNEYLDIFTAEGVRLYDFESMTVRQLLDHTSGIMNFTNADDWVTSYITARDRPYTSKELLKVASDYEQVVRNANPEYSVHPGSQWIYSNTNYILLGLIVETITGQPIGKEIEDRWIKPLGLTSTHYLLGGQLDIPGEHAKGYENWHNWTSYAYGDMLAPLDFDIDVTAFETSAVGASGCITSNIDDLLTWGHTLGNAEDHIGKQYHQGHINYRFFNHAHLPSYNGYGLGIAHEANVSYNADYFSIGHRGQVSGYDVAVLYLPDLKVTIAVMTNRTLLKENPDAPKDYPLPQTVNFIHEFIVNTLFPDYIQANTIQPGESPVPLNIEHQRYEESRGLTATY